MPTRSLRQPAALGCPEMTVPLQEWAADEQGYRWGKTQGQGEVRKLWCLVIFCLLFELFLALPVLYLMDKSLRSSQDQVASRRQAALPRQEAFQSSCSNDSRNRPRVHLSSGWSQEHPQVCMEGKQLPTLRWKNVGSGEENQIQYDSGYLKALKTGDYFVYAQVTFLCPDGLCEEMMCNKSVANDIQIQQVITRIRPGYREPLQLLKASSSIGEKDKWKKTLYTGGVVPLEQGDQIVVNVSNPALVDGRKPEITFFGAFFI